MAIEAALSKEDEDVQEKERERIEGMKAATATSVAALHQSLVNYNAAAMACVMHHTVCKRGMTCPGLKQLHRKYLAAIDAVAMTMRDSAADWEAFRHEFVRIECQGVEP